MDFKLDLTSFTATESVNEEHIYDLIIIGGGPAALNAALYAARKQMNIAIITEDIGGQIVQSSSIENWLGVPFSESLTLINKFFDHVNEYKVLVNKNSRVIGLNIKESIKKVSTSNQTYQAKSIIIATGKSPRKLNIPGEEEFVGRGVAYCSTCDGPAFQDKKVVVVGGGNSGVESALDLTAYAKEIVLIQDLDTLTADPVLVDKLLQNKKVKVMYNYTCTRIEGSDVVRKLIVTHSSSNEETEISTDGIFVEIGLVPSANFVTDLDKNNQGEIIINASCETSVPGIFAAGDVTDVPFKQVVIAAGEGAKAALSAHRYILNN